MNYIPLDEFKKAWVFRHKELPLSEDDRVRIKPMSRERAAVLWSTFISRENDHPDFFSQSDWVSNGANWQDEMVDWESDWEAGEALPPQALLDFLGWEDNTTVYFCMARDSVIETQFGVFKRCWQNFMFLVDGSLLIGKKRRSVVQFLENGRARLGEHP